MFPVIRRKFFTPEQFFSDIQNPLNIMHSPTRKQMFLSRAYSSSSLPRPRKTGLFLCTTTKFLSKPALPLCVIHNTHRFLYIYTLYCIMTIVKSYHLASHPPFTPILYLSTLFFAISLLQKFNSCCIIHSSPIWSNQDKEDTL